MRERPLALDLFCGAGGAAVGLYRAGFDVVGIDNRPQKRYPFPFILADALKPPVRLEDFDLIWASPPCQGYSLSKNNGSGSRAPRLIPQVRAMLAGHGATVIENVPGAPLMNAAMLCGASFGLGVSNMEMPRHRLFECSFFVPWFQCQHRRGQTMGVYGNGTNQAHRAKLGRNLSQQECRDAMTIDWMRRRELNEAIPPAYSEHIGRYAMMALGREG